MSNFPVPTLITLASCHVVPSNAVVQSVTSRSSLAVTLLHAFKIQQSEDGMYTKVPRSYQSGAIPELILEKQETPPEQRYKKNPVRWNPHQWRIVYAAPEFQQGKLAAVKIDYGGGQDTIKYDSEMVGPLRLQHLYQMIKDQLEEGEIEEAKFVDGADINLMLPQRMMRSYTDPDQFLLGSLERKELSQEPAAKKLKKEE